MFQYEAPAAISPYSTGPCMFVLCGASPLAHCGIVCNTVIQAWEKVAGDIAHRELTICYGTFDPIAAGTDRNGRRLLRPCRDVYQWVRRARSVSIIDRR